MLRKEGWMRKGRVEEEQEEKGGGKERACESRREVPHEWTLN